ncbi:MAG: ABC transporter permease [Acidobacteria bacterium]|nr:ABC transporter permease [Acidobacteriota bacterium]
MNDMIQDIRYAVRALSKKLGMTALVVVTLGVAMAGTVVIYSAIDMVMHLLPIGDSSRVVFLEAVNPQRGRTRLRISLPDFQDFQTQNNSFEHLGALTLGTMNLTGREAPVRVATVRASAGVFDVWNVRAASGRNFTREDDRPGAEAVAMLSHAYWQREFDADPGVIGQTLTLNGISHTVIGMLPPALSTSVFAGAELWLPLETDRTPPDRDLRNLLVTGLLKPGVTMEQSAADVRRIAERLEQEYPATNANFSVRVLPPVEAFGGGSVTLLIVILGIMAALLIGIGCANVANLLLAWSTERCREFMIRTALGSSRWRLVRQFMTEHLILSIAAAAFGLVLSNWGLDVVRSVGASITPIFAELSINRRVVMFTLALALGTPLGFGLAPALRSWEGDLRPAARTGRLRGALVVAQIAFGLTLLVGVGLLVRTMMNIQSLEKGFDPGNLLTARLDLPAGKYVEAEDVRRFHERLLEAIRAEAGIINKLPIADRELIETFEIEGQPTAAPDQMPWTARAVVSPSYRETMRIALLRGRDLEARDRNVVLISKVMAERYWPGEEPLGRRIRFGEGAWMEIAGVVGDVRNSDPDAGLVPQVYVPSADDPPRTVAIVIRGGGVEGLRRAVSELDKDLPIYDVATMDRVIFDDTATDVVLLGILVALAGIALVLSASGIYGVIANSVAERTKEIGIRMALGAQAGVVMRMVLKSGLRLLGVGMAVGLAGAYALGLLISSILFHVTPTDPATYGMVIGVLLLVTVLACWVPARRATRIDPLGALRHLS